MVWKIPGHIQPCSMTLSGPRHIQRNVSKQTECRSFACAWCIPSSPQKQSRPSLFCYSGYIYSTAPLRSVPYSMRLPYLIFAVVSAVVRTEKGRDLVVCAVLVNRRVYLLVSTAVDPKPRLYELCVTVSPKDNLIEACHFTALKPVGW